MWRQRSRTVDGPPRTQGWIRVFSLQRSSDMGEVGLGLGLAEKLFVQGITLDMAQWDSLSLLVMQKEWIEGERDLLPLIVTGQRDPARLASRGKSPRLVFRVSAGVGL